MRGSTMVVAGVAATACLSIGVTGMAGLGGPTTGPFRTPIAAGAELEPFGDCGELLGWYVDAALPLVGPYGFEGGWAGPVAFAERGVAVDGAFPQAAGTELSTAADAAVGSSGTGTNVQEAGVDEPDIAKTDGSVVVRVRDDEGPQLVVTDVSGSRPRQLATMALPRRMWQAELLLVGDTVVVTGQQQVIDRHPRPLVGDDWSGSVIRPVASVTRMLVVDIDNPADPDVTSDQTFEGNLLSARQYGAVVRLVMQTGYPQLDFVSPNRRRSPTQAKQENRRIVQESTIDDWLPRITVGDDVSRLVECDQVRHPSYDAGLGTLTVVGIDPDEPGQRSTTAVTAAGDLVYSSADRLYVATMHSGWFLPFEGRRDDDQSPGAETDVHAFELEGTRATYAASGTVPGRVRDRWSFSEHEGDLRIALAHQKSWETVDNGVSVLRQRGDALTVVGSVRGLGPREEIQSVRWLGELAIVVTFRQVDPLYTVDLSDPTDPRVLGELKIPGFSSYLHPIGDDRLLGLGTAATMKGRTLGAQLSVFDISRLHHPEQLSVLRLGRQEDLQAAWDPRTFTYIPSAETAFAAASTWSGRTRMIQLRVGADGALERVQTFEGFGHGGARALPLGDDRVALVGTDVELVTLG